MKSTKTKLSSISVKSKTHTEDNAISNTLCPTMVQLVCGMVQIMFNHFKTMFVFMFGFSKAES